MNKKDPYFVIGITLISGAIVLAVLFVIDSKIFHNKYDMILSSVTVIFNIGIFTIMKHIVNKAEKDTPESEYRKYLLTELESEYDPNSQNLLLEEKTTKEQKEEQREAHIAGVGKKDIIALMLKNNDEVNEYFKISKKQAQYSFYLSIIVCIIGIATISISIFALLYMKNSQFAIIGIASGAITELIAGTVLVIHNKSALQLNYYYDALHENEKTLSAINLADKLPEDQREWMYIEIIMAQIGEGKMDKKSQEK